MISNHPNNGNSPTIVTSPTIVNSPTIGPSTYTPSNSQENGAVWMAVSSTPLVHRQNPQFNYDSSPPSAFLSATLSTFPSQRSPGNSREQLSAQNSSPDFDALAQKFIALRDAASAKQKNKNLKTGQLLFTEFARTHLCASRSNKKKLLAALKKSTFSTLLQAANNVPQFPVVTHSIQEPGRSVGSIYKNPAVALHFFILALLFERQENNVTIPQFLAQYNFTDTKDHYKTETAKKFLHDARQILGLLNRKNYGELLDTLTAGKPFLSSSIQPSENLSSPFQTLPNNNSVLQSESYIKQPIDENTGETFHLTPDYQNLRLNRREMIDLLKNFLANFHPVYPASSHAKYFLELVSTQLEKQEEKEAQRESTNSSFIDLLPNVSVEEMIPHYLSS